MTTEYLVQMGPMWLTAGLTIGWLTQAGWRAGAYGLLTDLVLGVAGAIAAGGVVGAAIVSNMGMLAMFLIGAAGATALIAAQRLLWIPAYVGPGGREAATIMTPSARRAS